jgi:hypothetical protein
VDERRAVTRSRDPINGYRSGITAVDGLDLEVQWGGFRAARSERARGPRFRAPHAADLAHSRVGTGRTVVRWVLETYEGRSSGPPSAWRPDKKGRGSGWIRTHPNRLWSTPPRGRRVVAAAPGRAGGCSSESRPLRHTGLHRRAPSRQRDPPPQSPRCCRRNSQRRRTPAVSDADPLMWISTRDEWAGTLRRSESDIARTDIVPALRGQPALGSIPHEGGRASDSPEP